MMNSKAGPMEPCRKCNHAEKSHSPNGCGCGCAVFQSADASTVFNGLMARDEIKRHFEALTQRNRTNP